MGRGEVREDLSFMCDIGVVHHPSEILCFVDMPIVSGARDVIRWWGLGGKADK